jgi:hypothetical protein
MTDTPEAPRPESPEPPPPPEPEPFAPMPARVRTRWINPRRRWATGLIAAGAAVIVFIGGAATGFGIGRGDGPGHGSFRVIERGGMPGPDFMPWPGMPQRPGWGGHRGNDRGGPTTAPSTGSTTAPSTGSTAPRSTS